MFTFLILTKMTIKTSQKVQISVSEPRRTHNINLESVQVKDKLNNANKKNTGVPGETSRARVRVQGREQLQRGIGQFLEKDF